MLSDSQDLGEAPAWSHISWELEPRLEYLTPN